MRFRVAEQDKINKKLYGAILGNGSYESRIPASAAEQILQVREVLVQGGQINCIYRHYFHYTPLQVAIAHEKIEIALYLASYPGVNLHYRAVGGDNRSVVELINYHLARKLASYRLPTQARNEHAMRQTPESDFFRIQSLVNGRLGGAGVNISTLRPTPQNWVLPFSPLLRMDIANKAVRHAMDAAIERSNKEMSDTLYRLACSFAEHINRLDAQGTRLLEQLNQQMSDAIDYRDEYSDRYYWGYECLQSAAHKGNLDDIRELLEYRDEEIKAWELFKGTLPLSKAMLLRKVNVVKFFLNEVVDYAVGCLNNNSDYDLALNICLHWGNTSSGDERDIVNAMREHIANNVAMATEQELWFTEIAASDAKVAPEINEAQLWTLLNRLDEMLLDTYVGLFSIEHIDNESRRKSKLIKKQIVEITYQAAGAYLDYCATHHVTCTYYHNDTMRKLYEIKDRLLAEHSHRRREMRVVGILSLAAGAVAAINVSAQAVAMPEYVRSALTTMASSMVSSSLTSTELGRPLLMAATSAGIGAAAGVLNEAYVLSQIQTTMAGAMATGLARTAIYRGNLFKNIAQQMCGELVATGFDMAGLNSATRLPNPILANFFEVLRSFVQNMAVEFIQSNNLHESLLAATKIAVQTGVVSLVRAPARPVSIVEPRLTEHDFGEHVPTTTEILFANHHDGQRVSVMHTTDDSSLIPEVNLGLTVLDRALLQSNSGEHILFHSGRTRIVDMHEDNHVHAATQPIPVSSSIQEVPTYIRRGQNTIMQARPRQEPSILSRVFDFFISAAYADEADYFPTQRSMDLHRAFMNGLYTFPVANETNNSVVIPFRRQDLTPARAPRTTNTTQPIRVEPTELDYYDMPSSFEYRHAQREVVEAVASGVGNSFTMAAHLVSHPIDTTIEIATLVWDGVNALSQEAFGVASVASRQRNHQRGVLMVDAYQDFINMGWHERSLVGVRFAATGISGGVPFTFASPVLKVSNNLVRQSIERAYQRTTMQPAIVLTAADVNMGFAYAGVAELNSFNKPRTLLKLYDIAKTRILPVRAHGAAHATAGAKLADDLRMETCRTMFKPNGHLTAGAIDRSYASKQLPFKHNFINESELLKHFNKHAGEFKGTYKTPEEYLHGSNFVIEHGHKVKYEYRGIERTGYVRFMGNTRNLSFDDMLQNFSKRELGLAKDHKYGEAKFEFVAVRDDGSIATYHTESAEKFYKTINKNKNNDTVNVEHLSCRMM